MGVLVYVLGRSGTGKSYSMRNFPKKDVAVLNVQGKILPFRGSGEIEQTSTDDSEELVEGIKTYAKKYNSIVVDDFQYVMANEFMRRAYEHGWDKFTEIGRHAWDIADEVRKLPQGVIVYVMCHTDTDGEGIERLKTIGKMLDEKIFLEGMSTIVLKTHVADGKYSFLTQNNGKDTVKSPADMFPSYAIDNDLYYVDQKIREYYGLGATLTAEELSKADESAAMGGTPDDGKKKRGGSRRKRSEDSEVKAVEERNSETIANSGIDPEDNRDGIPFSEVEEPKLEEVPRRKRRRSTTEGESAGDAPTTHEDAPESSETIENEEVTEKAQTSRRRRRRG